MTDRVIAGPASGAISRWALSVYLWLLSAVFSSLWLPLVAITYLFERDPRRTRTARMFRALGAAVTRFSTLDVTISGQENITPGQTYVVVSNHQSTLDIPLLAALPIDAKWLVKAENFRIPVLSWMMRMAGDISVKRTDRRNAAAAWLKCASRLRSGTSIVTFPEGRRSDEEGMLPFLEGPFRLAIRENLPVLPVVVEGSGSVLPPNALLFQGRKPMQIHVLRPSVPDGVKAGNSVALRDKIYRQMSDHLAELRRSSCQV